MEELNFYSRGRINVGRRPSGRVDFNLRIDKHLLQRLREIAEAEGITIADLVEPKLIELVAVYDKRVTWARPDSNRGPSPRKGDVITPRPRAPILLIGYLINKYCGNVINRSIKLQGVTTKLG